MDIIKEKVSNWLGYFKDHINYFQIVDQQKSVIYFTKFTLEPKEFYDDDFMSMIKNTFKFEITNLQLFKVFCMTFFEKMKEEIKNLNNKLNTQEKNQNDNHKIIDDILNNIEEMMH